MGGEAIEQSPLCNGRTLIYSVERSAVKDYAHSMVAVVTGIDVPTIRSTLGVHVYLGHLAYEVSKDSFFFPFALALLGLSLILLTVWISNASSSAPMHKSW